MKKERRVFQERLEHIFKNVKTGDLTWQKHWCSCFQKLSCCAQGLWKSNTDRLWFAIFLIPNTITIAWARRWFQICAFSGHCSLWNLCSIITLVPLSLLNWTFCVKEGLYGSYVFYPLSKFSTISEDDQCSLSLMLGIMSKSTELFIQFKSLVCSKSFR